MTSHRRALRGLTAVLAAALALVVTAPVVAAETGYRAIAGSGSSWSANMVEQWTADVKQFGISVSYSSTGSSTGRREFTAGTVDYAVTEIPYGLTDAQGGYDAPPSRGFAYLPIVAGGTSFMYNLTIGGKRVTNLRLSGDTVAKIFTGAIRTWDDPAIKADNPGLALPPRTIVPVVRSDGSGTTAQFTAWMAKEHQGVWSTFCKKEGIALKAGSCAFTSNYPPASGFISQNGSLGVAGYVGTPTAEGAITYVEYSYALRAKFPVAKVLNTSGYYVEPTDQAVAVALLKARINDDKADKDTYLTQILDDVYRSTDPRSYPLSSYSYMVIPTAEGGTFRADKGKSLGDFLYYAVCEGQQAASVLGYSPLPQNLVQAGLEQVKLIPGVDVQKVNLSACNNPTFSPDGTNTLAKTAPQPPACDKSGPVQCTTGTGGARGTETVNSGGGAASGGGSTPGTTGGGAAGGGGAGTGTDAGGAPVVDPTAVGEETVVDPLTGDVVADAAGGTGLVSAVPVSAPGGTGTTSQTWLMALAVSLLVLAAIGPPVLAQRLSKGEGA